MVRILAGISVTLLLCSLALATVLNRSIERAADVEGKLEVAEAISKENKRTMNMMQSARIDAIQLLKETEHRNENIRQISETRLLEIQKLRETEDREARKLPFARGNASHDRIVEYLMRFEGSADGYPLHTSDAGASNTGTPNPTQGGE